MYSHPLSLHERGQIHSLLFSAIPLSHFHQKLHEWKNFNSLNFCSDVSRYIQPEWTIIANSRKQPHWAAQFHNRMRKKGTLIEVRCTMFPNLCSSAFDFENPHKAFDTHLSGLEIPFYLANIVRYFTRSYSFFPQLIFPFWCLGKFGLSSLFMQFLSSATRNKKWGESGTIHGAILYNNALSFFIIDRHTYTCTVHCTLHMHNINE